MWPSSVFLLIRIIVFGQPRRSVAHMYKLYQAVFTLLSQQLLRAELGSSETSWVAWENHVRCFRPGEIKIVSRHMHTAAMFHYLQHVRADVTLFLYFFKILYFHWTVCTSSDHQHSCFSLCFCRISRPSPSALLLCWFCLGSSRNLFYWGGPGVAKRSLAVAIIHP